MRLNDHGDDNGDDNGHILGSLPSHITTHRQDPKTWNLPPALTTFTSRSGRGHNPGDVLWQSFQTQPRFSGCVQIQKHGFAMSPQLQQKNQTTTTTTTTTTTITTDTDSLFLAEFSINQPLKRKTYCTSASPSCRARCEGSPSAPSCSRSASSQRTSQRTSSQSLRGGEFYLGPST